MRHVSVQFVDRWAKLGPGDAGLPFKQLWHIGQLELLPADIGVDAGSQEQATGLAGGRIGRTRKHDDGAELHAGAIAPGPGGQPHFLNHGRRRQRIGQQGGCPRRDGERKVLGRAKLPLGVLNRLADHVDPGRGIHKLQHGLLAVHFVEQDRRRLDAEGIPGNKTPSQRDRGSENPASVKNTWRHSSAAIV